MPAWLRFISALIPGEKIESPYLGFKPMIAQEQVFGRQYQKFIETLGVREEYRDQYWLKRDPNASDRLLW